MSRDSNKRDEIDVLFPDAKVMVPDPDTGEPVTITVKEFRFLDPMKTTARPLIDALSESVHGKRMPDPETIVNVMTDHVAIWFDLMALSAGREADWIARLDNASGEMLSSRMWSVNGDFLVWRIAATVAVCQAGKSRPQKSSTPSSGQDT